MTALEYTLEMPLEALKTRTSEHAAVRCAGKFDTSTRAIAAPQGAIALETRTAQDGQRARQRQIHQIHRR